MEIAARRVGGGGGGITAGGWAGGVQLPAAGLRDVHIIPASAHPSLLF